ncbi:MAG: hypothetical protein AB1424_00900 [Thermodesulfobacteriota bacterium]
MAIQTSTRDVVLYRGKASDYFAPAIILGWILTLALFGVEFETRWGKMLLPVWGGWRRLAGKILARIR